MLSLGFFRLQIAPLLVGFLILAASMMLYRRKGGFGPLMMFACSTFLALRILVGYMVAGAGRQIDLLRILNRFLTQYADLAYVGFCLALFIYAAGERATQRDESPVDKAPVDTSAAPAPSSSTEDRAETVQDAPPPE